MYLLLFQTVLLCFAVVIILVMKKENQRLLKENIELYQKMSEAGSLQKKSILEKDEPYLYVVEPSHFVDELNDRIDSILN